MRIVSYNIMNGGEGRADPLAEVILAQRPDVVALVESENAAVVERISGRLKMDYVHAPGNAHASTILSRWPIRESINHALLHPVFTRSVVEATIADPSGMEWTIGAVHLHPYAGEADEARREQELAELLRIFHVHRQADRPHLLVGDFNANSPHHRIDIARCRPSTQKAWHANGGQIPRRVVQKLAEAGYIDVHFARDADLGTDGVTFTTQFPGQRLDYIFACAVDPRRFHSVWIEQDRLARYASDHYPVGAEIG